MNLCFKCKKEVEASHKKHGLHKKCFKEWFSLIDEAEDFKDIYQPKETFDGSPEKKLYQTTFFHGKFKKYSAILGGKKYILKICQDHPELAKTEYLCNQLAVTAGLDIPKNYLIRFMENEDCFVTYNFMQDYQGGALQHIYHFIEHDQYNIEALLKVIEKKTNRLSELQKFINLCLFDALIGNNDRHGRNIGFISTASNYTLSPCYDNPSYFGIEDENLLGAFLNPKCSIITSVEKEPMIKDYILEFIRLGYKEEVSNFLRSLNFPAFVLLIKESFLSDKRKKAFQVFISTQYQELVDVL